MLFLIAIAKIILYILLFKGGKTDNGLSCRVLACFALAITNLIVICIQDASVFSYIFSGILALGWLIFGIIIWYREK